MNNNDALFKKHPLAAAIGAVFLAGTALTGCSSDDNSSTPAPEEPVPGIYTIDLSGGLGGEDMGSGGGSDYMEIYKYSGTGDISILSTGVADASFTPTDITDMGDTGANPFVVSANTTVAAADSYTPVAAATANGYVADTLYVLDSDGVLYVSNGDGDSTTDAAVSDGSLYLVNADAGTAVEMEVYVADGTATPTLAAAGTGYLKTGDYDLYIADNDITVLDSVATGISVASGATLTLGLNDGDWVYVDVSNDVVNHGTITALDSSATLAGSVGIYASSYIADGSIDTRGSEPGQDGGSVNVDVALTMINHGAVTSTGADATVGNAGDGGYIYLYGDHYAENTAALTSSGGNATGTAADAGNGGDADYVEVHADYADALNSGAITANGGNGTLAGGDADWFYLENEYKGRILNSSTVTATGGIGAGGNGGDGGGFQIYGYSDTIINSGDIILHGGDTTDAGSSGGQGGDIYFYQGEYALLDYSTDPDSVMRDFLVSGNIDVSGGDAVSTGTGSGGDSGYVYLDVTDSSEEATSNNDLTLLGYTDIYAMGGNGNYGGSGADVYFYNGYSYSAATDSDISGGNIINEANINVDNGSTVATATDTTANGNTTGHYIQFDTTWSAYGSVYPDGMKIINSGNLSMRTGGGMNDTSPGASGNSLYMWAANGIENSGNIDTTGGNDLATDGGTAGSGNNGQNVYLYSDLGAIINSGTITTSGGYGEYRGGDAGELGMYAYSVDNSGAITANGGDADATLAGSIGGDGDWIWIQSPNGPSGVVNTGAISNSGGAGTTEGDDASSFIGDYCNGDWC